MCVYLFHDPASGLYKIGWSLKPENRKRTLASQTPLIRIIKTWPGTVRNDEWRLHQRFGDKRVHGEWFSLDETAVGIIDQFIAELPPDRPHRQRRATAILSNDDLDLIIAARWSECLPALRAWATSQKARREKAVVHQSEILTQNQGFQLATVLFVLLKHSCAHFFFKIGFGPL